jgi:hypothetical protein
MLFVNSLVETGESNQKLELERNSAEKNILKIDLSKPQYFEICGCRVVLWVGGWGGGGEGVGAILLANINYCVSSSVKFSEQNSENLLLFLFHGAEFRAVFSSTKCSGTKFRKFASIFVPRDEILSYFFFRELLQNQIWYDCFYFCSTLRNSERFAFSGELFGTKFREFSLPADQPEFRQK